MTIISLHLDNNTHKKTTARNQTRCPSFYYHSLFLVK